MNEQRFAALARTAVPVVVAGVGNGTGLTIVRDLGRLGIPVAALDNHDDAVGFASRFALPVHCADPHYDEDAFVADLLRLGERLGTRAVVLPAQDDFVASLSRRAGELDRAFVVPCCPWETMRSLIDKEGQVRAAWAAGVATPRTAFLREDTDLEAAAAAVAFPAVLKPSTPLALRRRAGIKVLVVESPAGLAEAYERVRFSGPLMLQEAIPGGDDDILIAATYHDREHRPLAVFTGRKLRQHPKGFGNTRLAESRWSDEVAEVSLRLLAELRYHGVSDVEFKRDRRDGLLKLMEVNARHGLWAGLATAAGVNLAAVAYRDVLGQPQVPMRQRDGVVWCDAVNEVRDSFGEWRGGALTLRDWVRPYARIRGDAVLAAGDPLPAVSGLAVKVRGRLRRR